MGKALEFLELDFNDPNEAILALNFSSVDFRDIGKNKGTHSKTLVMPSTKKNDAFFGMSFEVSSEGNFDPLIKVPIQITDIEFYGTLQLKSVRVLGGRPISYSVNIFSDLADWASLIGEGSIRDLPRLGNHTLDSSTIEASWDNDAVSGEYVYPMISYGNFLKDRPFNYDIDPAFWRPAFFVLPLIKRIFREVGYSFIDTGFNTTKLKNAILPFTSKEVEIPELTVKANTTFNPRIITSVNNGSSSKIVLGIIPYSIEIQDNGNLFNNSNYKYLVPSNDRYDISLKLTIRLSAEDNKFLSSRDNLGSYRINAKTNNRVIPLTGFKTYGDNLVVEENINTNLLLNRGEILFFELECVMKDKTELIINGASTISIIPRLTEFFSGMELEHKNVIQNIKKIDLIKDIIRKGNFRVVTDNQKKTVEFIQESNFLLDGGEDWDSKVDESQPVELSLIQNQGAKELTWDYSNDEDDTLIKDQEDRVDDEWGKKKVTLDSEYRKGSSTVYTSIFSTTIDGFGMDGLRMPIMAKQDLDENDELPRGDFETSFENRILIYNGLRNGSFSLNGVLKNRYPQTLFTSDSISLMWDNRGFGFTGTQGVGLVDRYYTKSVSRLNGSGLYTGWFFLNQTDISNIDFRKPKIIKGIHYYLNRVIDYKVGTNQSTKVELISR